MRNLREGVDMVTVREAIANLRAANADIESAVYGHLHVRNRVPQDSPPADRSLGLFITSVHHKKQ